MFCLPCQQSFIIKGKNLLQMKIFSVFSVGFIFLYENQHKVTKVVSICKMVGNLPSLAIPVKVFPLTLSIEAKTKSK